MGQITPVTYKAATFSNLRGLQGISDQQLEQHFELYGGYVRNTNTLNEQIAELMAQDKGASPACSELTRRLGFEYNGMILHEYYFGNLTPSSPGKPSSDSELSRAIEQGFGDFDTWLKDFRRIGAMRGVGWAILYADPANGRLSNHWVTLGPAPSRRSASPGGGRDRRRGAKDAPGRPRYDRLMADRQRAGA